MINVIIIIASQFLFSYFRTLNVKHNTEGAVRKYLFSSSVIKISWLVSTYIGVNAMIMGDYLTAILYLVSGVLGDYVAIKKK